MKANESVANWVNACDALDRAGGQLKAAFEGDTVSCDYAAGQVAKAARYCLLCLYFMEGGIKPDEAKAILSGIRKLTGWGIHVSTCHESHGERRGR